MHSIATSAPAAPRRYAQVAVRPKRAQMASTAASCAVGAHTRSMPLPPPLQHVRQGPVQRRRCHRLRRTAAAFSPLVAGFRLEGFCEHTGLDHESRAAEDKRTVKGSKAMAAACEECAGRGSCGCHAEGPRTAGEQPRARAQHGHRGANGGAVRHRRALSAELSRILAGGTAELSYYRA